MTERFSSPVTSSTYSVSCRFVGFFRLPCLCSFATIARFAGGQMFNNKRILKTGALAAAVTVVFAIFAFRAAEWTKGLDSEFLVYGADTGSTTGTNTGTGSATTVTKVVPQIAAG